METTEGGHSLLTPATRVRSAAIFKEASKKMANQSKVLSSVKTRPEGFKLRSLLSANQEEADGDPSMQSLETITPVNGLLTPSNTTTGSTLFKEQPTEEERIEACRIALKTYFELRSLNSKADSQKMIGYIEENFENLPNFGVTVSQMAKTVNEGRKLTISCELVRGSGLPSKDLDGSSDPYVKMVVLKRELLQKSTVQKHNISDWVKEGLMREEDVRQSTVKFNTLEPEWDNEHFEFTFTDPKEEYLVIEVWDSDEDPKAKKGLFNKLLTNKDDFMGRAFYCVTGIPTDKEDITVQLFTHTMDKKRGTLTLRMALAETVEQQSEEEKCDELCLVSKVIFAHESTTKDNGEFIKGWNGILSITGIRLLSQCASIRAIPKLQETSIRFSLLMDYHESYAVSISTLMMCIGEMRGFDSEIDRLKALSSPPDWVSKLLQNVQELYSEVVRVLRNHFTFFDLNSSDGIEDLKAYINTLKNIYGCRSFIDQLKLDDGEKNFTTAVSNMIQETVTVWFKSLLERSQTSELIVSLNAAVFHCQKKSEKVLDQLVPIFNSIGVDYFSPFFCTMDTMIHLECERAITSSIAAHKGSGRVLYRVYQALLEIKKRCIEHVNPQYLQSYSSSNGGCLYISSCHQYFKEAIPVWIELLDSDIKGQLKKAVDLDPFTNYMDEVPFSSSAFDAYSIFLEVIKFWKDINWPERDMSVAYFGLIIQTLYILASYYVDLIKDKLSHGNYTDDGGKFVITTEVCIALNDIQHVKTFVMNDLSKELDLESYYSFLAEGDGTLRLRKTAEDLWNAVMESAVGIDIGHKNDGTIKAIYKKMIPTMTKICEEVMQRDESITPDKAIEPLLDYIAENMAKLGEALVTANFIFILEQLWIEVVDMIKTNYETLSDSKNTRNSPLFIRLKEIALALAAFFDGNGNGLTKAQIETPLYKSVLNDISVAAMSDKQAIRFFLKDLVEQQRKASGGMGVLHFSHIYSASSRTLKVNVLHAENILPLDKSGLSDPFVIVHLLPVDLFSAKPEKTPKRDQTLNPQFNTLITIPVDEGAKLKEEGAVLLLAMFDHDMLGANDFAGICVASANKTPQGNELKMEHLNLFCYQETPAYEELEKRSTDSTVNEFLKLMKTLVLKK